MADALEASRDFWEAKAAENPYWYVSSFGPYERSDLTEFWRSGVTIWSDLKKATGFSPRQTSVVVEIGCGVGRLTRAIAPEVGHVHAFDISENMLELTRHHGLANVTLHRAEGETLRPLANDSADLVLGYCVFQHLPSEQALASYVAEMFRVVRSGGIVAFTLTPPDWRDSLEPLLRLRRWFKEMISSGGPRGLYRREWIGIRPTKRSVMRLLPPDASEDSLHGDKWLFCAKRAA